jgi:DNA-binding NarL/FixJ family response regulator
MAMRLLIAAPDDSSIELYCSLLASAQALLPLDIVSDTVMSQAELTRRIAQCDTDVLMLDWLLAGTDTPRYLHELLTLYPELRSIVVTPLQLRQYRQCLWESGACVGLPKEFLDQEWLLSMLCLITRAMQREAKMKRLLAE